MKLATYSLLSLLVTLGCADGPPKTDPAVVENFRKLFVLAEEPAEAVTALDWRDEQAAAEEAEEETPADQITLVGRVGGMPNPWGGEAEADFPWRAGVAAFYLVDPATAAEFADHAEAEGDDHAANCPFCAREAANQLPAVAAITFSDAGKVIAIDARELFSLNKDDLVVVQGKPKLVGDLLTIEADGLFIRN